MFGGGAVVGVFDEGIGRRKIQDQSTCPELSD